MHAITRVLAVAYVVLAVAGALVYAQTSLNFVHATEIQLLIAENANVTGVEIVWDGNRSNIAEVHVFASVRNPGRIPIEIRVFEFDLYMDNPADSRPWYDPDKLETTYIRPGGFLFERGYGYRLNPGETRILQANATVEPLQMGRFDRPDLYGRYHPVVLAKMVYAFIDLAPSDVFDLAPYYSAEGVLPVG